ncbi:hypothetical protein [Thiolapillus sp.]|uniref:hypothetical protein n=1 Tax=Thiolapillus sp. TaxID=2017437 RepID=UPI0025D6A172|nr:hypothetical protein [Thiolapillus sp.]
MTRTAGARIGCQRPSRFWGLGRPKFGGWDVPKSITRQKTRLQILGFRQLGLGYDHIAVAIGLLAQGMSRIGYGLDYADAQIDIRKQYP